MEEKNIQRYTLKKKFLLFEIAPWLWLGIYIVFTISSIIDGDIKLALFLGITSILMALPFILYYRIFLIKKCTVSNGNGSFTRADGKIFKLSRNELIDIQFRNDWTKAIILTFPNYRVKLSQFFNSFKNLEQYFKKEWLPSYKERVLTEIESMGELTFRYRTWAKVFFFSYFLICIAAVYFFIKYPPKEFIIGIEYLMPFFFGAAAIWILKILHDKFTTYILSKSGLEIRSLISKRKFAWTDFDKDIDQTESFSGHPTKFEIKTNTNQKVTIEPDIIQYLKLTTLIRYNTLPKEEREEQGKKYALSKIKNNVSASNKISDEDILNKINEQPKSVNLNAILVIIISFAAFVFIGKLKFSTEHIVMLAAVIALHEIGHILFMKLFDYKDLKLLFIPLFGAIASGKKVTRYAYKRAIVSLAGPIPGLIIGMCIIQFLNPGKSSVLWQFSLFLIVINLFNLLPIFPLDGGKFLEEIIFSRTFISEMVFKIFASCAILLFAFNNEKYLAIGIGIGVGVLGSLIMSSKLSKATKAIKEEMGTESPNDTLDLTMVKRIRNEIDKGEFENEKQLKIYASFTEVIWNRIISVPAGFPPTLSLLGIYLVALISGIFWIKGIL